MFQISDKTKKVLSVNLVAHEKAFHDIQNLLTVLQNPDEYLSNDEDVDSLVDSILCLLKTLKNIRQEEIENELRKIVTQILRSKHV